MIVLVCILVPCIGFVVLGGVMWNFGKNTVFPVVTCAIGFELVRDGIKEYAKEHDGKLPNAETWQDDVRPYYKASLKKDTAEFGPFEPMSPEGAWGCKVEGDQYTGMAFNSDLSGKKLAEIEDKERTVLIFEIEKATTNAHEPYKARPRTTSPKMMGEHRGWVEVPVEGELEGIEVKSGTKRIKVD